MTTDTVTSDKNAVRDPGNGLACAVVEIAAPTRPQWYVIKTKSRQEKALARALRAGDVEHELPMVRRVRYHAHRKRIVHQPLFATYVFLRGSVEATYFAISTRRVSRVLPIADQARFVHELEQIRRVIALDGELDPFDFLTRGRHVRVTSGPFRDIEGVVEDWPKTNRLLLQVEALGRAMSLEIDPSLLEPVD